MKKLLLVFAGTFMILNASAQTQCPDFTIKTTDGVNRVLSTTLNQGKTVLLDFFFTTCGYCIQYAPIIDQFYAANGSGTGSLQIWGIDNGDSDAEVDAYKTQYGVTNPCASGSGGSGNSVTTTFQSNFNFTGWPTYSLVCPNGNIYWDINYPPTATGFDSYVSNCAATVGVSNPREYQFSGIDVIAPNPATENVMVAMQVAQQSKVQLQIVNMLGQEVKNIDLGAIEAGGHVVTLNLNEFSSGNYLVKMICDNKSVDGYKLNVIK